jgi:hypothetical protein
VRLLSRSGLHAAAFKQATHALPPPTPRYRRDAGKHLLIEVLSASKALDPLASAGVLANISPYLAIQDRDAALKVFGKVVVAVVAREHNIQGDGITGVDE